MRQAAAKFHAEHPDVWRLFVRFTRERIERGFKHYGYAAIFNQIRWECDKPTVDGTSSFKINNNHGPFYARRFMRMYPEYAGFFRTREQISRHQPPSTLPELGPADYPTWPQPPRQIAP